MKPWSCSRIAIVLVGFFIGLPFLCGVVWVSVSFSRMHGELPSDQQAIALYDDTIQYFEIAKQSPDLDHALPDSVEKLNPHFFRIHEHGVVVVFGKKNVEHHGLYYTYQGGTPIVFCQEQIAPGIYRYYDPG